jgi:hypothetical protein
VLRANPELQRFVFALGALLWECCFYNYPHSRDVLLDNFPPSPFRDIFVACTQEKPEDRPSLTQLGAIEISSRFIPRSEHVHTVFLRSMVNYSLLVADIEQEGEVRWRRKDAVRETAIF